MGQRREMFLRILVDSAEMSAATAHAAAKMPENAFRKLSGAFVDMRGTLRKMPNRLQIGGQLLEPTVPRAGENESIAILESPNLETWGLRSTSGDGAYSAINNSKVLVGHVTTDTLVSPGGQEWGRAPQDGEAFNTIPAWNGQMFLSFSLKTSRLPVFDASMAGGAVAVLGNVGGSTQSEYRLCVEGVAVEDATWGWELLPGGWQGVNVLDGQAHTISIKHDTKGAFPTTSVSVDGEQSGGAKLGQLVQIAGTDFFKVRFVSNTTIPSGTIYSASMWNFLLRDDTDNPVVSANVQAACSRDAVAVGDSLRPFHTFLATNNYVWVDEGLRGQWRAILRKAHPGGRFSAFRESIIVTDFGANEQTLVYDIDRNLRITVLDDAPNLRVVMPHSNRLWGFGDRFKLRLYFGGDRLSNQWFSPDTDADGVEDYDEAMDAGFLTIQGEPGEYLTAFWPNFYGSALAITDRAAYEVTGNTPLEYGVKKISDSISALSQECVTRVGNDVWCVGKTGVSTLQTTQKFGDILAGKVSLPIQNIFTDVGGTFRLFDMATADKASLVYNSESGLVHFHFASLGSHDADTLWTFNTATQQWYGPTQLTGTRMAILTTGLPESRSTCIARLNGVVEKFSSFEDVSGETVLLSGMFTGRSLNPQLASMVKTWGTLRILCNPRGSWPVMVSWRVPGGVWRSKEVVLDGEDGSYIGDSFTVGDSALSDSEDVAAIDVELDARGKSIEIMLDMQQSAFVSIISLELELRPTGFERG